MKYFKLHHESYGEKCTEYGAFDDSNITRAGNIDTTVYSVHLRYDKYKHDCYKTYTGPKDITEITKDEYMHVMEQLQKVDELQSQIDEILAGLIKK